METTTARPVAVVTGASAGIGECFARELARRGYDLWLVARRRERLEELAREFGLLGAQCKVLALDLATEQGPAALVSALDEASLVPALFVNNAGFGYFGYAEEQELGEVVRMLRLNVEAVSVLSLELARRFKREGRGGLLTVASTAGFQPTPFHAVYGATKAYDLLLSEALAVELEGTGVRVMAVCPGYTTTEFQQVAGVPGTPPAMLVGDAADCARKALDAFDAGETVFVHGVVNRLGPLAARLLPRAFVARAGAKMFRPKR